MPKSVSIVEARRELGRLAEEVRRTRRPVILTNRGRAVARISPEPTASTAPRDVDPLGGLRGSVQMTLSFDALERAIRSLRRELARSLERRVGSQRRRAKRDA